MKIRTARAALQLAIGVVIASAVLQTWLVLGWVVPIAVSGSSMAPALLGPHRMYRCTDCRREFAVGLDQLPPGELAVCPACGKRRGEVDAAADRQGQRLAVDRTAFAWREPRRWETVVFRCPKNARDLCVKRVVGLPGESISLDAGDVLVDGEIARKSLADQRALRQEVDSAGNDLRTMRLGDVELQTSARWHATDSTQLEYRHHDNSPITDESGYNQAATPPMNRVADVMLTFEARLAGAGQLVLTATNDAGRCEVIVDSARHELVLNSDGRPLARRPLPAGAIEDNRWAKWTFSLFDRQVLLAIGDQVLLSEPWEGDPSPDAAEGAPLAIGARNLIGEVRRVAVWRDAYYAVRHSDGRQPGVRYGAIAEWRLGPGGYFVVGDNAAISDDSRSWSTGWAVDAKLLIGKPLGAR